MKRTGIKRGTKPLRSKVGLKPGRRLRAVSPTNKRWNAPGRARPDEPLAERCQAGIEGVCTGRAEVRHHIIRRGPGSSDEASNTLDICDADHRHIHRHVEWAKAQGYLRSRPPLHGLPTCAYFYFGAFLCLLFVDVLAVGVAVVTKAEPTPRVVYEIEEGTP